MIWLISECCSSKHYNFTLHLGQTLGTITQKGKGIPVYTPVYKKEDLPQPQLVQYVWQAIQKYPVLYHQTSEQLLSSGYKIPQLILNTPPKTYLS